MTAVLRNLLREARKAEVEATTGTSRVRCRVTRQSENDKKGELDATRDFHPPSKKGGRKGKRRIGTEDEQWKQEKVSKAEETRHRKNEEEIRGGRRKTE